MGPLSPIKLVWGKIRGVFTPESGVVLEMPRFFTNIILDFGKVIKRD